MLAGFERWHPVIVISGGDPINQLTFSRLAGNDSVIAGFELSKSLLFLIETQAGFALVLVRAMTGVTILGKDWADIAVIIDFRYVCRVGKAPAKLPIGPSVPTGLAVAVLLRA